MPQPYSVSAVVEYSATAVNHNYFGSAAVVALVLERLQAGFFGFFASGGVNGAAIHVDSTNGSPATGVFNDRTAYLRSDRETGIAPAAD
jgi:hypothetical protein